MSTKVWIDRHAKEAKFAKALWEANFVWTSRIMNLTCLYPFQKRSVQIIGNIVLSLYLLTAIASTILKIVENCKKNQKLNSTMVECIFQLACCFGMMFCYLHMVVCKKKIHTCAVLMVQMKHSDPKDTGVVRNKVLKLGYYISTFLSVALIILSISFGLAPIVIPSFLNWVLPGNQTYEKSLPLHVELFLSEDKFFYQILTVQLTMIFIFSLLIGAINAFQFSAISFIIGEIRVLEYLLRKLDIEYKLKILDDEKVANKWIFEQIQDFVKTHQTCIKVFNVSRDVSDVLMFGVLIITNCIVILTATSMVILVETDMAGSAKMLFALCVVLVSIIIICFPSQILKNASDDLFSTCYEVNLHSYPVKIQKMLLFVMARSMRPFVFTAGPIIELNLETCTTIIKTSLSYAAAFRSFYTSL